MPHVLLATYGTLGDVLPFFAIARALKEHGAEPLLLLDSAMVKRAEEAHLMGWPVGEEDDLGPRIAHQPDLLGLRVGERTLKELYLPFSTALYHATREAIAAHRPSAVVSHPLCFGSAWAARDAGVPSVVAHLAPSTLFTRDSRSAWPLWGRVLLSLSTPVKAQVTEQLLVELSRRLHRPASADLLAETIQRPDLLLALWSPYYCLPTERAYRAKVICGFPSTAALEGTPSDELTAFFADGPAPVAIAFGTSIAPVAGPLIHAAVRACHRTGHRGVILGEVSDGETLPDGMTAAQGAPYSRVLPACVAVIHHGGIGTTAASLYAGRPQVVIPFGPDHRDNARRLCNIGVARVVSRRAVSERSLGTALSRATSEPTRLQAMAFGRELLMEPDGARRAALAILSVGIGAGAA